MNSLPPFRTPASSSSQANVAVTTNANVLTPSQKAMQLSRTNIRKLEHASARLDSFHPADFLLCDSVELDSITPAHAPTHVDAWLDSFHPAQHAAKWLDSIHSADLLHEHSHTLEASQKGTPSPLLPGVMNKSSPAIWNSL